MNNQDVNEYDAQDCIATHTADIGDKMKSHLYLYTFHTNYDLHHTFPLHHKLAYTHRTVWQW